MQERKILLYFNIFKYIFHSRVFCLVKKLGYLSNLESFAFCSIDIGLDRTKILIDWLLNYMPLSHFYKNLRNQPLNASSVTSITLLENQDIKQKIYHFTEHFALFFIYSSSSCEQKSRRLMMLIFFFSWSVGYSRDFTLTSFIDVTEFYFLFTAKRKAFPRQFTDLIKQ